MALAYKPGVDPAGALEPIRYAIAVAEAIYAQHGATLTTVTSLREGVHIVGSLHPLGLAVDFRTHDLQSGMAPRLAAELAAALGGDYDVILERDHIHVEYDPPLTGGQLLPRFTTPAPDILYGPPPAEVTLPTEFSLWDVFSPSPAAPTVYHQTGLGGVPWWAWLAGGLVAFVLFAPRR